jgi:hypothetical protein
MTSLKLLKIAAAVEAVTVCLLFANLLTCIGRPYPPRSARRMERRTW